MVEPKTLKELYDRQVSFEARVLEMFDRIADTLLDTASTLLEQERQIKRLKEKVKK